MQPCSLRSPCRAAALLLPPLLLVGCLTAQLIPWHFGGLREWSREWWRGARRAPTWRGDWSDPPLPCKLPQPVAVWSRGIMRSCCDTFPTRFQLDCCWGKRGPDNTPGEAWGERSDVDWTRVALRNMSIVYVAAYDMPRFLARFITLPPSIRISLVTAQEDVGVPRELFGSGRNLFGRSSPAGHSTALPLSLEAFIRDSRLLHWSVQNYDLAGCNTYSGCAPAAVSAKHLRKVSPIPLGIDMHTADERNWVAGTKQSTCGQQAQISSIATSAPPLPSRRFAVLHAFACNDTWPERIRACQMLLAACDHKRHGRCMPFTHLHAQGRKSRPEVWRAVTQHAFVACPPGRGIDTHRLWEVLLLGAIPIVLSSSLDRLLADFPVVAVQDWGDATNVTLLTAHYARITARFGPNLIATPRARRQLTTAHWVDHIKRAHAAALGLLNRTHNNK